MEPRLDLIGPGHGNSGVGQAGEIPQESVVGFEDSASGKIWSDAHDVIVSGAVYDIVNSVAVFGDLELLDLLGGGRVLVVYEFSANVQVIGVYVQGITMNWYFNSDQDFSWAGVKV